MISYIIWNVSPEIFTIPQIGDFGPFPVRWYGLLFAAGFLVGQQVMIHVFKKEGKPLEDIDSLTLYMVLSTVIGARLGHFIFYEPEVLFKKPLEVILPPYAGLASHGAIIGIITGLWLYSRSRTATGQTFLWVADRMVIVIALAGAFIRFGNLMNSEIVGKPTDVPWSFVFVQNTEFRQIPRHAAQLYESISCFILFFILLWIWNKYKSATPRGLMVGIFFVWVFTLRFLYEFLKENQEAFEANYLLNMGQILSIPAVLLGLYFIYQSRKSTHQLAG
ncbi:MULTISPECIES: prolipoprotein diacylglyceryl transferase [Dyadobacter]|jgi:phosphatidylglycerol:prolipoprotein diacylglycerol transferase|uniref:Phosphatidylglycerol--prolipoprotein diacylglyceryl transferase n=1 Tax=Dyadobacter chenhuakuii TaxID=2909339 RepID=A0A9X1TUK6_9BACT|nr:MULTISPECIES: prolipoprotein diacylglyceryl transferase [Dyadobacter]MCE7069221.1 prolipoprotein diacylglyceryl transferase [Dyadobacter sp. CY327]MCF2495249.1 prolipoprotein diacylglyceryl transferase [Dyadobacter chenhuakuii]MCF2500290.1 prolipoprotein diacylglyceryl transferase [Dyadobacter chenhuakuii]USJ29290.1 prolipoprotein diacylglyceryl transferase [Dyadobacter chenhuakuii]